MTSKEHRQKVVIRIDRAIDELNSIRQSVGHIARFTQSSPELEQAIRNLHDTAVAAVRIAQEQKIHNLAVIERMKS